MRERKTYECKKRTSDCGERRPQECCGLIVKCIIIPVASAFKNKILISIPVSYMLFLIDGLSFDKDAIHSRSATLLQQSTISPEF